MTEQALKNLWGSVGTGSQCMDYYTKWSETYDKVGISCAQHLSHYDDVIMGTIASQITSLTIVYSTVYSGADQSKHQSSASLAFVWGIHRGPVNSPHKWPVTRKMFPFDDVIMLNLHLISFVIRSHKPYLFWYLSLHGNILPWSCLWNTACLLSEFSGTHTKNWVIPWQIGDGQFFS